MVQQLKTGGQQLTDKVKKIEGKRVVQYNNLVTVVERGTDPPDPDYMSPDAAIDKNEISRAVW